METRPQRVNEQLAQATERLETSGSETARLDAELLLGHVLGVERTALMAHPDVVLSSGQLDDFEAYLVRREAGEPVAYIRGLKEFYGTAVSVDARVLIPRPETETLVALALERITADLTSSPRSGNDEPYLVWDMGTGSGAIPVAIAMELRRRGYGEAVRYFVSDISGDARDLATVNVVAQGLAHLFIFAEGDLVDVAPTPRGPVDLLLANLPYIPSGLMPDLPVAAAYEPVAALDGGPDGLDVIRRLLPRLPEVLAAGGSVLLEIGGDQAESMTGAAGDALPGWSCTIHDDLSESPRVAQLDRPDA